MRTAVNPSPKVFSDRVTSSFLQRLFLNRSDTFVLVNWDGGDVTAATSSDDYNQAMPEEGTIFRMVTSKRNLPGDVLLFDAPESVLTFPNTFYLYQNYPNPFNPNTQIRYYLVNNSQVKLEIFNLLGQRVRKLIDHKLESGEHTIFWDGLDDAGRRLGSGIYFYRLKVAGYLKTRKMTLLR